MLNAPINWQQYMPAGAANAVQPAATNYADYLAKVGYSGGANDPWKGRGIQRQEKGNSDFDASVPWTGLQSGGITSLDHALQAVSGYYTSQRDNKWWGKYFDKWAKQYGKQYDLTPADFTKDPAQLSDKQKFGLASMLDTRYRAIEDETAKPPEFLGGFLDKIIKFAGPAVGILTGNPLLGALAGTLAGAPGKGFNVGAGLLGAAGGAAAGYFSPGVGGGGGAAGSAGSAGAHGGIGTGATGITTPTGGGLVGHGLLNPAGVGILGNTAASGIPLGFSPLAVAGGAAAMPGITALPTGGQLPGTNIVVGDQGPAIQAGPSNSVPGLNPGSGPPSLWDATKDLGQALLPGPEDILRQLGTNALTNALGGQPVAAGGSGGTIAGGPPQQGWRGLLELESPYKPRGPKIPAYMRGLLNAY